MTPTQQRQMDVATSLVVTFADTTASDEVVTTAVARFLDEMVTYRDGFIMLWTLSVSATKAMRHALGQCNAGPAALAVLRQSGDGHLARLEPDQVAPTAMLVGRWMTAAMNDDMPIAVALFKQIPEEVMPDLVTGALRISQSFLRRASTVIAAREGRT